MKKSRVDTDTKLLKNLTPDDALKYKLAVATRSLGKKEKSSLYDTNIKSS